ncbi:helix-turn-helix transcriptional regulator [Burkholderia gladioli]|uniref:helix-turn-helix transcriptional regulator n=1 Tax=Burkholderia gladioli TaxID=28095 RepID=UPI00163ECE8B|nr:helix-turn-helix transcriptional regulator [Burkholderia gladioli]
MNSPAQSDVGFDVLKELVRLRNKRDAFHKGDGTWTAEDECLATATFEKARRIAAGADLDAPADLISLHDDREPDGSIVVRAMCIGYEIAHIRLPAAAVNPDLEELLSRYWSLAYDEGESGESRGDEANEVLSAIRRAARTPVAASEKTTQFPQAAAEPQGPAPSLTSPLTPYGMLVRALRIVAGKTLMDMAKHVRLRPAELSALEFGRKPLTDAVLFDTARFFSHAGIDGTITALRSASRSGGASLAGDPVREDRSSARTHASRPGASGSDVELAALLELAAKAAQLRPYLAKPWQFLPERGLLVHVEVNGAGDADGYWWNPLRNDGDRYLLAKTVGINIDFSDCCAWKRLPDGHLIQEFWGGEHGDEPHAVVRAAAEVGKSIWSSHRPHWRQD